MRMSYGKDRSKKYDIMINRTNNKLPNACIFGQSGTGKQRAAVHEIEQVITQGEGTVIIIDRDGYYTRDERIENLVLDVRPFEEDSEYHINPLDLRLKARDGETLWDCTCDNESVQGVGDAAVLLIGEILEKELAVFETAAIRNACNSLFIPLAMKLREEKKLEDAESNPTLSDVVKTIIGDTAERESEAKLIGKLKEVLEENKSESNKVFADRVGAFLDRTFYHSACLELRSGLERKLPVIKQFFSYKTNMPLNTKSVQLSWGNLSDRFDGACNAACLAYVNGRLIRNLESKSYLWIYQENADTIFRKANGTALSEFLAKTYLHCRPYGGVMTLIAQSFADVLHNDYGRGCINNTELFRFMSMDSEDRRIIQQLFNLTAEGIKSITNVSTGEGALLDSYKWIPFTLR